MENEVIQKIENQIKKSSILLKDYATKYDEAIRLVEDEKDFRLDFQRDSDRIIHSHSYTRYINKTQVYSNLEDDNISRRMTHVQFVSRAARTIARGLGLNEDLCEAISLGHDVGHVPFGHFGEIQVLDGIMCHNGEMVKAKYAPINKTKEDVLKEYEECRKDESKILKLIPMTLEGCVVRVSDIIGYIGKDIDDARKLEVFDIDTLPESVKTTLGSTNVEIMNNIITDIMIQSYGKPYIQMSENVYEQVEKLKIIFI